MGDKIYKVNESVLVIYQPLGGTEGITDLTMIVTDPQGNDSSPVTLVETSGALYEATFTPDEIGRWYVKVYSPTYKENAQKVSYLVGYQEGQIAMILQDQQGDIADITPAGRLKVSQEVSAPLNTTLVKGGAEEVTVDKQGDDYNVNWDIPIGEIVTLQKLTAGAYVPKDGDYGVQAKFRLVYQPNGNTTGEELIEVIYFNEMSDGFRDLQFTTEVGDGTRRIRLEITNWSVEDIEATSFFKGYY